MNCENGFYYTIQYADTIYEIAKKYSTTVEEIMQNNPYISPYNLQIGMQIYVCPNTIYNNMRYSYIETISTNKMDLMNNMRTLWMEHILWTRQLLISIAESLKDLEPTKMRLLRNSKDLGKLYSKYYGEAIGNKVDELITEHLVIGGDLIVALKDGNNVKATELNKKWYENADKIAEALSSFNTYYNKEEVRKMMYDHLALTTNEVKMRLAKDYKADIAAYDKVEKEVLDMADYFTEGIAKQKGL